MLGQYRGKALIYKGHVTLGVGGESFAQIKAQPRVLHPPFTEPVPAGHGNEDAIWVSPSVACVVEFMNRTKNGGMRQPVFKGIRMDKSPKDCIEKCPSSS